MINQTRRRRKRQPTLNGRFQGSEVALEMGLVKMAIDAQKEFLLQEQIKSKNSSSEKLNQHN